MGIRTGRQGHEDSYYNSIPNVQKVKHRHKDLKERQIVILEMKTIMSE